VRPLSGSIGAEILGIDLASEPGDNVIGEIRQVWLEHNVVFFRDQDLPPAKFLAFAKRFGEVVEYPFIKGIEGFPEIIPVIKLEHETKNFGGIWHTDTAYLEIPPMGTMLIACEVPPCDTLFANTYLAYGTLSEGVKRMLDGLIAVNYSAKADVTRTREDRLRDGGKAEAKKEYISEHPVVRTHPETGRKALYVNIGHTVRFKDMTEAESAPLPNVRFRGKATWRLHREIPQKPRSPLRSVSAATPAPHP
jgi:taurine dioxygenase